MPQKIIRQDITKIKCDAIVNPTDPHYSHGGGADAAIHEAAGVKLYHACVEKGWLEVGHAVITPGFDLPCKYVIHTVGPVWEGGEFGEEALLRSCYAECLGLAAEHRCKTVAIPLISSGVHGFPKDRVLRIATDAVGEFLMNHEMLVYIVVFDKTSFAISEKLFFDVESYIGDTYVEYNFGMYDAIREKKNYEDYCEDYEAESPCASKSLKPQSLDDMLAGMKKGFAETLFEFIDKKGITDVECYKLANVDKKTFSKIKCNKKYKPSKVTAVSFAIALRLDIDETDRLLNTVGMALSHSERFDVIIEYFITSGNYKNIFDVNEVLYQFGETTLGV